MSECLTKGVPKSKHISHSSARREMKRLQKQTPVHLKVYKCSKCKQYHIGSTNQLHSYIVKKEHSNAVYEKYVGKLIGVLRLVLNKEKEANK